MINQKDTQIPQWNQNKNFMVLKLLSCVPEFIKDVSEIRNEMGIKERGFDSPKDEEDENESANWASKNNFEYYQSDNDIKKDFPSNIFEKRILGLGIKYKLPFNFYAFYHTGLIRFILTGDIVAPSSNYDTNFHEAADKSMWVSLMIYAPLSEKELEEAMDSLRDSMSMLSQFFKGVDVLAKKRYRSKISRDLSLFEEQVERTGKPKKVKNYGQGSYLDILSKDKTTSTKTIRDAERKNKKGIVIEYDNPTSKQIGKRYGVSGDATRQAKKRLNSLAQELFGYDLEL